MSSKNIQTKKTSHSIYNINYHIVFCPKYRHHIFKGELEPELSKCFKVVCDCYGYDLIEQAIMPDHVHLFISAPPTIAPVNIVRKLKSISANEIFEGFPQLEKSKFWGSGLWSRGYYVGTTGTVSSETIQIYIKSKTQFILRDKQRRFSCVLYYKKPPYFNLYQLKDERYLDLLYLVSNICQLIP